MKLARVLVIAVLILALGSVGCAAWRDADEPTPSPVTPGGRPVASGEPTVTPPPTVVVPTPEPPVVPTPEPPVSPQPPQPSPTPPPPAPTPAPTPTTPVKPTDNKTRSWWYTRNDDHAVPTVAPGATTLLKTYNGRYVGPNRSKVYLTFDQGY